MRTRRQTRASQAEEAVKDTPMLIEDAPIPEGSPAPEPAASPVPSEEPVPLGLLNDDAAAFLKIEPAEGEAEGKLQRILDVLNEQQATLRAECENKLRKENANAEKMRKKLMKKIESLPDEFLDESAEDNSTLTQIIMPVAHNMPSCHFTRTSATQMRVIRVFNKDTDADHMLKEWDAKYEELSQLLKGKPDEAAEDE